MAFTPTKRHKRAAPVTRPGLDVFLELFMKRQREAAAEWREIHARCAALQATASTPDVPEETSDSLEALDHYEAARQARSLHRDVPSVVMLRR